MGCKVSTAEEVLSADLLKELEGGLLFVSNDTKKATWLGWIREAFIVEGEITFFLGRTIKKWEDQKWKLLGICTFKANTKEFIAMELRNGYFFSNTLKEGLTFRVYPASAVKSFAGCEDESTLISLYGDFIR